MSWQKETEPWGEAACTALWANALATSINHTEYWLQDCDFFILETPLGIERAEHWKGSHTNPLLNLQVLVLFLVQLCVRMSYWGYRWESAAVQPGCWAVAPVTLSQLQGSAGTAHAGALGEWNSPKPPLGKQREKGIADLPVLSSLTRFLAYSSIMETQLQDRNNTLLCVLKN